MSIPRADVATILEHVGRARAELASAQALITRSVEVAEILGGQPLGDFNEAVRRLLWFVALAEGRMKDGAGSA